MHQLSLIKRRILTRSWLGGAMRNIEILVRVTARPARTWFAHPHRWKYARCMATRTKPASSSPKQRTPHPALPPINLEHCNQGNREKLTPPASNRKPYDGRHFFVMAT